MTGAKKLLIYYLTEDVQNAKERNELELLRRVGKVILVTPQGQGPSTLGLRRISLPPQQPWLASVFAIWASLALLLGGLANSKTDLQFPARNIYMRSAFARNTVNAIWAIKSWRWLNALLPSYDFLFFAPFALLKPFNVRRRASGRFSRVVIHDALLIRLHTFAPLVSRFRAAGVGTIGNVKSWDNPFCTQLALRVDAYLVWSQSMWRDVERVHGSRKTRALVWGARPFYSFFFACRKSAESYKQATLTCSNGITVGYAAAFGDSIMATHEVRLLRTIAQFLGRTLPEAKLLLRPYPTLSEDFYGDLLACPNVKVASIDGDEVDRFGDGREVIRFGSDQERLNYLAACDCFLSLATSFTIEAAIFGLPIVHFYLDSTGRSSIAEKEVFRRVDISDHLLEYFLGELPTAKSYDTLVGQLRRCRDESSDARLVARRLLTRLGIIVMVEDAARVEGNLAVTLHSIAEVHR